ncbi:MAG: 2-hydroxy-6-oxonona-2,4-dienedioate hydrolase [Acidobacteriota bacterium]|nr:2-hydroxy-6-oxonona-2,4-dienedioate hydrolase [Acidobacteriota bacterium]
MPQEGLDYPFRGSDHPWEGSGYPREGSSVPSEGLRIPSRPPPIIRPVTPSARRIESRFVQVSGLRMHVRLAAGPAGGGGAPLVLVHGLGVSSRYMVPLAEILASSRAVYAPDIPGFGKSDKPRRALDIHQQAEILAAWMSAMGLDRAAFFGHSLGCQVVADLAYHHPEAVDRLVLAAPTIDDHGRSVPRELLRLLRDVPREPFSLVPIVAADYLRAGLGRALRTLRYGLADRIEEKLPRLAMPALVLRGERDPVVSEPWTERVCRLLPRGRLAIVPKAAHAFHFSAPREVAGLLIPFLDEDR